MCLSHACCRHLVVSGGVACNQFIRAKLQQEAESTGLQLVLPKPSWCTDNGVMVGWAGVERWVLDFLWSHPFLRCVGCVRCVGSGSPNLYETAHLYEKTYIPMYVLPDM